jgi:hypothetical protein
VIKMKGKNPTNSTIADGCLNIPLSNRVITQKISTDAEDLNKTT